MASTSWRIAGIRRVEVRANEARALDEELESVRLAEWRDRILLLAGDLQDLATRDHDSNPRRAPEQVSDLPGRGRQELLQVVHHQKQRSMAQMLADRVGHRRLDLSRDREGIRDGRRDEPGIAHRGELHEPRPVAEQARDAPRQRDREPRLAGPARSRKGQQTRRQQQPRDLGQLLLPPDEGGDGLRKVRRRSLGPERPSVFGRARHDEPVDDTRLVEVAQRVKTLVGERGSGREPPPRTRSTVVSESTTWPPFAAAARRAA